VTGDDGNEADRDEAPLAGQWYADRFRIGQNAFEFKVDCGHKSDQEGIPVYFRVIANPANARELFRQIGIGLLRYADRFGRIEDDKDEGNGNERGAP
jgi:hypothetical protein